MVFVIDFKQNVRDHIINYCQKSVVFRQKEEVVVKFLTPYTALGNVNTATIIPISLSSFSRLCRQTS